MTWPTKAEDRRRLFLPALVAALRSNKYKQHSNMCYSLRSLDGWSAAGVALDLGNFGSWTIGGYLPPGHSTPWMYRIPWDVQELMGITDEQARYLWEPTPTPFALMADVIGSWLL